MTSEIGHKELTQVDVHDAGTFGQPAADRVHRDDILRVIVAMACRLPNGISNFLHRNHHYFPSFSLGTTSIFIFFLIKPYLNRD